MAFEKYSVLMQKIDVTQDIFFFTLHCQCDCDDDDDDVDDDDYNS